MDVTAESIELISNKVDDTELRIAYQQKPELKVVYVARISAVKGHADLIKAWRVLPALGLHLYLIGPEDQGMNIVKVVSNGEFANKVTCTGPMSNVREFISDADIGVFPSYKEGLPLALLEKMQIGIPCVVSNIKELASIVEDNISGLVYRCGNTLDLANKITELAKDQQKRKALGTNAATLIKESYVSKVGGIDKEYELYYDRLLLVE